MDIVDPSSQQFDFSQGFEATQASATQLDCLDFEFPIGIAEPIESAPKPFARLMSLSVGVPHIEMLPHGEIIDGMLNRYSFGRGKKKGCDFIFDDQRVSSLHCHIYCQAVTVGGSSAHVVWIRDESANGTFVNGQRVGKGLKHALRDGDELSLIKPEEHGELSEWDKARFIVKIPAQPVAPLVIGVAGAAGGATAGAEGTALRRRLGTISRLLQQERLLNDHYQVVKAIGEGAHGQVYLAFDKKESREWAVKFIDIRRASLGAGSAVTTILKEAEIMKNLNHRHIVNLEDVFADGVNIYLVMELLSGGDLFDRVVQKSKYSEPDALELMHQLLDAISYLHGKGIAHRDLKLENIMLVSQDSDVDIKITDFGLAKTGGKLKTFCGTPNYYSPEVLERRHTIRGEGSYSVAADMWSCGVILYVLLSGEMPWRGHDIDRCIREAKFTPMIGRKWSGISEDAKALIKGLLEPDQTRRLTVSQALAHPWFAAKRVPPAAAADAASTEGSNPIDSNMSIIEIEGSGETASGSTIRTGISTTLHAIKIADASPAPAEVVSKSKKRKLSRGDDTATATANGEAETDDFLSPKRRTLPRKCRSEKA